MIRSYISLVDGLSRLFAFIAILLLVVAMLVICELIFIRYVFRWPTIWETDFVVYSATAAIFLGSPYVLMTNGHVSVDLVENALSGAPQRVLRTIARLLGLFFCAILCVASAMFTWEAWAGGWLTSSVWQIPQWIPVFPMPIGFGLLCLQYVAEFLRPKGEAA